MSQPDGTYNPKAIFATQIRRNLVYWSKYIEANRYNYTGLIKERDNIIKGVQSGLRNELTREVALQLLYTATDPLRQIGDLKRLAALLENGLAHIDDLSNDQTTKANLLLRKSKLFADAGSPQEALSMLDTIESINPEFDTQLRQELIYYRAKYLFLLNRLQAALTKAEQSLASMQADPVASDQGLAAYPQLLIGKILSKQGEHLKAQARLESAIDQLRENRDIFHLGQALTYLGLCLEILHDPSRALPHYKEALNLYVDLPSPQTKSEVQINLGRCFRVLGDLSGAEPVLRAIPFQKLLEVGARQLRAEGITELAYTIVGLEEYGEARMLFESALEEWGVVGNQGMVNKMRGEMSSLTSPSINSE